MLPEVSVTWQPLPDAAYTGCGLRNTVLRLQPPGIMPRALSYSAWLFETFTAGTSETSCFMIFSSPQEPGGWSVAPVLSCRYSKSTPGAISATRKPASVTSITARLIGALNLVASYTIRNNSDVPVGTEKTDTRTAISLEYAF